MTRQDPNAAGRLLIDAAVAKDMSDDSICEALLPLIRSNIYRVDPCKRAILIEGPDVSHQTIDPDLKEGLRWFGVGSDAQSRLNFHQEREHLSLALEDSWCGVFLARHLAALRNDEPLTIIHLDDHSDMMSTLLIVDTDGDKALALRDPLTGAAFDPASPTDWHSAIASGAITIGSFLTPFFALERRAEVFHLKADLEEAETFAVVPAVTSHDLLTGYQFYAIELTDGEAGESGAGRYHRSNDPHALFARIPQVRRAAVHIDLDYFLNDYNGNSWQVAELDMPAMRQQALERLDQFFSALQRSGVAILCWMIGVSPGFCSARHWHFLVEEIERRIADLEGI